MAVLVGLVLAFLVAGIASGRRSLAEHGVKTTGRVAERYTASGKSSSNHIGIKFDTPKGAFAQDFTVSDATYQKAEIGGPFPVFYDATDPANATADSVSRDEASEYSLKCWLAWAAGGAFVGFVFYGVSEAAKGQSKKLALWPLGELRVTRVTAADSKGSTLSVSGSYLDAKGRRVEATGIAVAKSVHVEEPISILYDPSSDQVVTLDSLGFVELA